MMTSDPYAWLTRFWDDVIARRDDRRWLVATLHDGHVWLRDPMAWSDVRHVLRPRSDVDFVHVRAWSTEPAKSYSNTDFFLIGRPKPYIGTRFMPQAHALESKAVATFHDGPRGNPGKTVSYGPRITFRQHEIEASPEYPPRCDVDFGVLLYREDKIGTELCRLVAVAGVGQLATSLLTRILTDDVMRASLKHQVADIAPNPPVSPEQHTEVCVRFEIAEDDIEDFLDHGRFKFQVEVVAFGKGAVHTRRSERELTLVPYSALEGGGIVRSDGNELKVPRERFLLLRRLVEAPEASTTPELCRYLAETSNDPLGQAPAGRLSKLVHDLNKSLHRLTGIEHIVRFSKKSEDKCYVLGGVHATVSSTVYGGPAPSRSRRPVPATPTTRDV